MEEGGRLGWVEVGGLSGVFAFYSNAEECEAFRGGQTMAS